jgi:hypothetical protein
MYIWICSALLIIYFTANSVMASESSFVEREIREYPFSASAERTTTIRNRYQRVIVGMRPTEVIAILGEPDEIRRLYSASSGTEKHIGYTYWFVIHRAVENGSVNERQEVLVRVSFDLNGLVMNVDHWPRWPG